MKYHVIPTPKQVKTINDPRVRNAVKALSQEMNNSIKYMFKRDRQDTFGSMVYLFDEKEISTVLPKLNDSDSLIFHAEGQPFTIGPIELSPYSLRPFCLAEMLINNGMPDKPIHIELMSCNSATAFQGSNYAKDLSNALCFYFDLPDIEVTGYTGYINVKKNGKFSVSSQIGQYSGKNTHYSLERARATYINGELKEKISPVIQTMSDVAFSWAENDLQQLMLERRQVQRAKDRAVSLRQLSVFFPLVDDSKESQANVGNLFESPKEGVAKAY